MKLTSISAFNSPLRSLGLGSLISAPLPTPPSLNRMVRSGRWPHARSQGLEHASQAGWEWGEGRGWESGKSGGDWLIPVAGAWSLRLLSALLQPRSGRRLRSQSGPIRREPAPAGETAIGQSPVTKRDKGRRGKKRGWKKKKERKRKRRLLTGWASAQGFKLPGDRRGSRCGSVHPDAWEAGEDGLAGAASARRRAAGEGSAGAVAARSSVPRTSARGVPPCNLLPVLGPSPTHAHTRDKLSNKTKVASPTTGPLPLNERGTRRRSLRPVASASLEQFGISPASVSQFF